MEVVVFDNLFEELGWDVVRYGLADLHQDLRGNGRGFLFWWGLRKGLF